MTLGREGSVGGLQRIGGAFPGLGLEAAVLAQAEGDALTEALEKGGLVGRRPAEARGPPVAVDSGDDAGGIGADGVYVVLRHDLCRTGDGGGRKGAAALGWVLAMGSLELEVVLRCGSWMFLCLCTPCSTRRSRWDKSRRWLGGCNIDASRWCGVAFLVFWLFGTGTTRASSGLSDSQLMVEASLDLS